MIASDEDAVICDLAEAYGIYDIYAMDLVLVARLVFGLRDNSRIKQKIKNEKITREEMLLAVIADRLGLLLWFNSEDGAKRRNRPKSLLEALTDEPTEITINNGAEVFRTGEDFKQRYNSIIKNMED